MSMASVVLFWAVSMLFVLTPGADWAYAMAAGMQRGVFWSVTGMLTGHLLATLMVAAGLATMLASFPVVMAALTVIGSLYLGWLGARTLRQRHDSAGDVAAPGLGRHRFITGLGVSLLNPKVFLLFLALLPQFVTPGMAWPVSAQLLALGAIHVGNCAIIYYAVGYGAGTVLTGRPRARHAVTTLTGIVLIALGAALAIEQLTTLLT